MECDLEGPPKLIPRMVDKWEEGYPKVPIR